MDDKTIPPVRVIRQGVAHTPDDIIEDARTAIAATWRRHDVAGIAVVDGYGLRIAVERGHLIVLDGFGKQRRERRYARATHGLSRLVVIGNSGYLTLDALGWCDRLGIAVVILDSSTARPTFATTPHGLDDARLRRAQARAVDSPLGLEIASELLSAKVWGQAAIVRKQLGDEQLAETLGEIAGWVKQAPSLDAARQLEAGAAVAYWQKWASHPGAEVRFTRRDAPRVPEHWRRFDGRRSVLQSANGNKRAERPANALLNYLFALAEIEAILACRVVGLNPGLGFIHMDARSRDSLAFDVMEPIRCVVESYVLDILARRSFHKADFAEGMDGHVRILPPLTHGLAETLPRWRQAVAPWAEYVVHLLADAATGKVPKPTKLTGTNLRQAQAEVKARKLGGLPRAEAPAPKQRPTVDIERQPQQTCRDCGAAILGRRRLYCPACGVLQSGQDGDSRARRGPAIAAQRAELERWRIENPGRTGDAEAYRTTILPALASIKLAAIMSTLDVAKSTASMIRSGRHVPALRHWPALAELGGRVSN